MAADEALALRVLAQAIEQRDELLAQVQMHEEAPPAGLRVDWADGSSCPGYSALRSQMQNILRDRWAEMAAEAIMRARALVEQRRRELAELAVKGIEVLVEPRCAQPETNPEEKP